MIIIKGIHDEDFINYKKPSMVIAFPHCTFKCDIECGKQVCQNGTLVKTPNIEVNEKDIVQRYLNNLITKSIVIAGLEPFDDFEQLLTLISEFRKFTDDEILVFTGFTKDEIANEMRVLKQYKNIIIKYGRFIPDQQEHYDKVLGIYLASDNQYAERIS